MELSRPVWVVAADEITALQIGHFPGLNESPPPKSTNSVLPRSEWLDHAERRPHASWLRQVESYLKDTDMAGLASAWAMARRRPKEYRRKVDAATRCSGVCPHT